MILYKKKALKFINSLLSNQTYVKNIKFDEISKLIFMRTFRLILFILALILYCFIFQGRRGLFERDEGRYTCVSDNMLMNNNWIIPHLDKETPHWTKPPLTYWLIASSIKMFGHNEFAVRFPGALAYFLTAFFVLGIAKVFFKGKAWVGMFIYLSFMFPFIASNVVTTDNLLTMFEVGAVFFCVKCIWGDLRDFVLYG